MSELDPCMSFGFLISSEEEFVDLYLEGIADSGMYSIFHIVDSDADKCKDSSIMSFSSLNGS